jgi:hypothetical protein
MPIRLARPRGGALPESAEGVDVGDRRVHVEQVRELWNHRGEKACAVRVRFAPGQEVGDRIDLRRQRRDQGLGYESGLAGPGTAFEPAPASTAGSEPRQRRELRVASQQPRRTPAYLTDRGAVCRLWTCDGRR